MSGVPSSNMKAKPMAQNSTPQMQVSAMPSTRMLTDSRSRAKPDSSMTNPTCMPNTRNAAIRVQAVLTAFTVAIGSTASDCAAPAILGTNHDTNPSTASKPIILPVINQATLRRITGLRAFTRQVCQV